MIKAIVFDCFGVLTGDKWKEFVGSLSEDQREPARELNRALDSGYIDLAEFTTAIHELTGRQPERVEEVINAEMTKNQPLFDYIGELKTQYKIGLLSNISSDWITESFLSKSEAALFDAIVLSHHVGATKPSRAMYEQVCNQLRIMPAESVLIDDSVPNCEGARAYNMIAIEYHDFSQLKRELTKLLNTDN